MASDAKSDQSVWSDQLAAADEMNGQPAHERDQHEAPDVGPAVGVRGLVGTEPYPDVRRKRAIFVRADALLAPVRLNQRRTFERGEVGAPDQPADRKAVHVSSPAWRLAAAWSPEAAGRPWEATAAGRWGSSSGRSPYGVDTPVRPSR